jgi:3-oxoacyl-[acyl-carrier protein] reductase
VTGGGHGIGKAYCHGLAAEGARVVVAEIDERSGRAVAEEICASGGAAAAVRTDVADEVSTRAMAAFALERFGRIDVLVNNAAVFATIPISRVGIEDVPVDEWDRVMAVNLRGVFLASRAVLPAMKERGYGKIVNISSGTALSGSPLRIHYTTSKGGVLSFTRTLANEVGSHGITVNSIAPGNTLSEEDATPEVLAYKQKRAGARALGRVQLPADLVGTVVFLASADSDFITGQTIVVDGGAVMH